METGQKPSERGLARPGIMVHGCQQPNRGSLHISQTQQPMPWSEAQEKSILGYLYREDELNLCPTINLTKMPFE